MPLSKKNEWESRPLSEKKWLETEGELAVDVYSTKKDVVIQSAVAGVDPKDLNISVENDMVIIKGDRKNPVEDPDKKYYFRECYWGKFSRKIIVTEEIDPSRIDATVKNGVLIVRIPKIIREKSRVEVKEV